MTKTEIIRAFALKHGIPLRRLPARRLKPSDLTVPQPKEK